MKFDRLFSRKPKVEEKPQKLLPEDVRYALKYKEGLLNKEDIKTLVRSNFVNEAIYLTFKSLINDAEKHRQLLEKYISYIFNDNTLINKRALIEEILYKALDSEQNVSVKGSKLAQLSRQGFDLWQEKYEALAQKLSTDERNVYLLAHSTFIGLEAFLKKFSETNKTLNILVCEWTQVKNMGYVIDLHDKKAQVSNLQKPFKNNTGCVLIDDTKNTGNTLEKAEQFLEQNGCQNLEIMVLDKAL